MTENDHTRTGKGPLVMAHSRARDHLLETGDVYTFRAKRRKTTGLTHWRKERTGKKQGNVYLVEVGEFSPRDDSLDEFAPNSGFDTLDRWRDGIREMNNDRLPASGWLYLAELPQGDRLHAP